MSDQTIIRRLHQRKESLTIVDVERLVGIMRSVFPEDDMNYLAWTLRRKAQELNDAESESERIMLAAKHLDWLVGGFERDKRHGKKVYYARWKKGGQSLMGDQIDVCPVCGRKGEINRPNSEYEFAGITNHTVSPFFMGQQTMDFCRWDNSTNTKVDAEHNTKVVHFSLTG